MKSDAPLTAASESARVLIARALDGTVEPAESARLAALLERDADARAQWAEQVRADALLRALSGGFAPKKRTPRVFRWLPFAAAAIVLLSWALVWGIRAPAPQFGAHARVAEVVDTEDFAIGQIVSLKQLELKTGRLRCVLEGGARLAFSAPVILGFENDGTLTLKKGSILLETERPEAAPRVRTPDCTLANRAEGLGVSVCETGTQVVVFAGSVRLTRAGTPPLDLDGQEAVRVAKGTVAQRIPYVVRNINDVEWEWSSQLGDRTVVRALRDNVRNRDFFYRLAVGGLREGVPTRYGGEARWFAETGKPFPRWIENADVIETPTQALQRGDLSIEISLSQESLVCVLYPEGEPIPNWLRDAFSDSGARLYARGGDGERAFAVWSKVMPTAGSLCVGAMISNKKPTPYTVVAKALALPPVAARDGFPHKNATERKPL